MKSFKEIINEARDLANTKSVDLWAKLKKLGFTKSGQVMTVDIKKVSSLKLVQDIVDAINLIDKTKLKVKEHGKFIDIV